MLELYTLATKEEFIPENKSISWKEDSYLWMCELQKWLRENHGIHINIDFGLQWGYQLIPVGWYGERFSENFIDGKDWLSYEQALENGLLQALKLIK